MGLPRQKTHQLTEAEEWINTFRNLGQNPGYTFRAPLGLMLDGEIMKMLDHAVETQIVEKGPSYWGSAFKAIFSKNPVVDAFSTVGPAYHAGRAWGEKRTIRKILQEFMAMKTMGAFTSQEQQLMYSMAELHAAGSLVPQLWLKHFPNTSFHGKSDHELYQETWERFMVRMVWCGGKCELVSNYSSKFVGPAQSLLREVLESQMMSHTVFLERVGSLIADAIHHQLPGTKTAKEHFSDGDRFFEEDDIDDSSFVNADETPDALRIGTLPPHNIPIGLAKSTSIFVSAAPGAGKTQGFILPNLLSNRGSAFVIDFKGELYRDSAPWRADHCGPVFRFDPGSPTGDTAVYNPLDFIPRDRMIAPVECQTITSTMISEEGSSDNVWPLSAQRLCSALLSAVCMCSPEEDLDIVSRSVALYGRALPTLNRLLGYCSVVPGENEDDSDTAPNIMGVIKTLNNMGMEHQLPDLCSIADQMYGMANNSRMRESVLLNARAGFGLFSSQPPLMKAVGGESNAEKSAWSPEMLRTHPGTSVYVTISAQQMKDFAPLLRLMIKQHISHLERYAEHNPIQNGEPPCTFYFDEFSRLSSRGSPFDEALHITEQGRGANMRAIYITQGVGQLVEVWGAERAKTIVSSCEAAIYLSPGMMEIDWLKDILGTKRNIFNGEEDPIEFIHNLRGRKYKNKSLVVPNGDYFMVLDKELAYDHPIFKSRMKYRRS